MSTEFEDKYIAELHNIEFAITAVYRDYPELTDWDVLRAVESLINDYKAELAGREPRPVALKEAAEFVRDGMRGICEMHLGREHPMDENGQPVDLGVQAITIEEIVACLKRIRRSVETWSKRNGRQGYLDFVKDYV